MAMKNCGFCGCILSKASDVMVHYDKKKSKTPVCDNCFNGLDEMKQAMCPECGVLQDKSPNAGDESYTTCKACGRAFNNIDGAAVFVANWRGFLSTLPRFSKGYR